MSLNRTDLIVQIARISKGTDRQLTRKDVAHVLDILLDIVEEQLTRPDGAIHLGELGRLEVRRRVRRRGTNGGTLKNIHTDELIHVPRVTYRVQFQPTRTLKAALRARLSEWTYLDDK